MFSRWQDWAELFLGIWLFFSPWLLGYSDVSNAATNAYLVGIAIVGLSILEIATKTRWEEWTNLLLGVWLVLCPWALGFNAVRSATQNMVVVGIIMVVLPLSVVRRQTQRA